MKSISLGCALLGGTSLGFAQDAKWEKLEQENAELRKRLEALEHLVQKEGIMPSGDAPASLPVKALSEINLSGFVTTGYFFDTSTPHDGVSNGYLWNTKHNSFTLNKVKLTLESGPVERSGEKWDAGFRTSLIFGEDAPLVNTGGEDQGFDELREAYVELNAPIGTGLNVKAGQLISLLNYESGDGGAVNNNFSQGYQWFYTGNGPSAGVQLGYTLTDWLDVKFRVSNGLYGGPVDVNNGKGVMGSIGIKPDDKTWISLVGFGGDGSPVSDNVQGGSVLAGRQWTEKFNTGLEFDYFNFDPFTGDDADLWSTGVWAAYDFTKVWGLALRAEFIDDVDGFGVKGVNFPDRPNSAITSPDADGSVTSIALTLNYRPLPSVKIQPEVRYDYTSYKDGFDGQEARVVVGMGASYLF